MKKSAMVSVLLLAAVLLTGCGNSQSPSPAATEAPAMETTETETAAATETTETETAAAKQETLREIPEAGQASPDTAANSLKAAVEAVIGDAAALAPFTADELADMTGIAPEDCSDFVFLQGDGMDGREILVIRAKDEAAADRVADRLEKYLERRKKEHRDYAPDAYRLLTDAKVERKGLLLAVISGRDAAAELAALMAGE